MKKTIFSIILCFIFITSGYFRPAFSQNQEANAKLRQAFAFIKAKKYRNAVGLLLKVISENPSNKRPKYILAKCYEYLYEYDNAAEIYARVLTSEPGDVYAISEMANTCLKMYRIDKAIYFYKQLGKKLPTSPISSYWLMQAYMIKGKNALAKEYMDTLENMAGANPKIGILIKAFKVRLLISQHLLAEALKTADTGLDDENARIVFLGEKFSILLDMSNLAMAKEVLNEIIRLQQNTAEAYDALIRMSFAYNKNDEALSYIKRYGKKFGKNYKYYSYLGKAYLAKKMNEKASVYFLKAIARNRYNISPYYELIDIYIKLGKFNLANQWLSQFLGIFKEIPGTKYVQVKFLYKQGKKEEALKLLNKIISKNKGNVSLLINASYFLWNDAKKYKEALVLMEYAYKKYPLNNRVMNNLSYFYSTCPVIALRKPSLSLKLAKKAVKESSWLNAAYIDTLASAYFVNGNRKKALEIQKKALLLNPVDKDFIKNLKKYRKGR